MKKYLLGILLSGLMTMAGAQDLEFARQTIEEMASPKFQGRGYVAHGDKIGARYVAHFFRNWGMEKFDENYMQYFNIDVNTFPGEMAVLVKGDSLKPGEDFLIDPSSGRLTAENLKIRRFFWKDKKKLEKRIKKLGASAHLKEVWVFDPKGIENKDSLQAFESLPLRLGLPQKLSVVQIDDNKFTWSVAPSHWKFPLLKIRSHKLPKKIKRLSLEIDNLLQKNYQTQNVVSLVKGSLEPDSFIVFSAHYDHLGRMGKDTYIPGANDNASGTTLMLNLARYYQEYPGKYSMLFIAFGAEECGLIGSKYFVENSPIDLGKIKFLINMDIMGTGDQGMTVVNGSKHPKIFDKINQINREKDYLVKVKKRGPAANSDHHWFDQAGVPAFFFYTMGGIKAYHDIYDKAETLPLTEYEDIFRLIRDFVDTF